MMLLNCTISIETFGQGEEFSNQYIKFLSTNLSYDMIKNSAFPVEIRSSLPDA